ncbi:hypothetical protein [Paludisphaera rhizosphaerae]|uniref:hypothetical protein n=1 Tax=Paludisphaera rhizosphaerae TaxID=2711216 RepID=UPI0013EDB2D6|nr:hypothetical protein [Paludisphaera rhizosphaerae]
MGIYTSRDRDFDDAPTEPGPELQPGVRMYVHEPGWRVTIKRGSDRVFCHTMTPGQDYYHRLLDGELYLHQDDERVCLACASRRGIISYEARRLPDEAPKFLVDAGTLPVFIVDDPKK